jgi:hypothetical protein
MPFILDLEPFVDRALRGVLAKRAEVNVPWPMSIVMGLLRRMPRWLYDLIAARVL